MNRFFALLALILLLSGCLPATPPPPTQAPPPAYTASPSPSSSAAPSRTPVVQRTSAPIVKVGPTRTAGPTRTPRPTQTPKVTKTPVSGAHLSAIHYSGQTFLVWDETGGSQVRYRIYRASQPLTFEQLDQATWLAELSQGSANFYADRFHNMENHQWEKRYLDRLVVPGLDRPLPAGKGLFVWTISPDDLNGQASKQAYYLVTISNGEGMERLYGGYTVGPVDEAVGEPLAVDVPISPVPNAHLMVQYMDIQTWNPTFHAPNSLNDFYGLHPTDPRFDTALQYAYDYVVYNPVCDNQPEKVPVVLYLEDFTRERAGRGTIPEDIQSWCAYKIYPFDTGDTRWFGFADFHDYRQVSEVLDNETISNYTEQRLLRMVNDLLRRPPGPPADVNKIYVMGWGSGGKAAAALTLRFGNVFAAGFSLHPVDELSYYDPLSYEKQTATLLGSSRLDLPVYFNAPANLASPLQDSQITTQSTAKQIASWLAALDSAPLGVQYNVGHPSYHGLTSLLDILTRARQSWSAFVIHSGTTPPLAYRGLPPALQPDERGIPFFGLRVVRNETIPAFSSDTLDTYPDLSSYYGWNSTVLWSSSWLPWHGAPVDEVDRWEMSFCPVTPEPGGSLTCGSGVEQRVDITPRRLQKFAIFPGMRMRWQNYSIPDSRLIESGQVKVADDGTLTIRSVLIVPQGSRLVIFPLPNQDKNE